MLSTSIDLLESMLSGWEFKDPGSRAEADQHGVGAR